LAGYKDTPESEMFNFLGNGTTKKNFKKLLGAVKLLFDKILL
jgi:hypothetical protein